jgi:spore maturation protein CgeB
MSSTRWMVGDGKAESTDVVVVGASPDRINRNAVMRRFVREGFAQVLGATRVLECALERCVDVVTRTRPRLVLCFGSCMPDVSDYGPLRDCCDRVGAGLAFWLHDDPYEFDFGYRAANVADWLFSNDRWATMHYDHPRAFFLPMAASERMHWRTWRSDKQRDVFFCGVGFPNRVRLLTDLAPALNDLRCEVFGAEWPGSLPMARNERLTNDQVADACAASWMTLNMGRSLHLANRRFQLDPSTPGPRTFEAAMAGTVQLCFVEGLEITDFFTADEEILLFDDPAGFRMQVERLLDEPERARAVAQAAQARALRDHTYASRAREMLSRCGWTVDTSPVVAL